MWIDPFSSSAPNQEPALFVHFTAPALRTGSFATDPSLDNRRHGGTQLRPINSPSVPDALMALSLARSRECAEKVQSRQILIRNLLIFCGGRRREPPALKTLYSR